MTIGEWRGALQLHYEGNGVPKSGDSQNVNATLFQNRDFHLVSEPENIILSQNWKSLFPECHFFLSLHFRNCSKWHFGAKCHFSQNGILSQNVILSQNGLIPRIVIFTLPWNRKRSFCPRMAFCPEPENVILSQNWKSRFPECHFFLSLHFQNCSK